MTEPKRWRLVPADDDELKGCPDPLCDGQAEPYDCDMGTAVQCTGISCGMRAGSIDAWQRIKREGEPEGERKLLYLYKHQDGSVSTRPDFYPCDRYDRKLLGAIDISTALEPKP